MGAVAVLGGDGTVGAALGAALTAAGHDVRVLGRPTVAGTAADGGVPDGSLAGTEVVVVAAGPAPTTATEVRRAAVRAGVDVVDLSPEPSHLAASLAGSADIAAQGRVVVSGAGPSPLVGELLALLAAGAIAHPEAVHVGVTLPGARLGDATPGVRATLAELVGAPVLAWVDGELVEEPVAAERRLAWFPRPVGPTHAAAVPAGEPVTLPRQLPGVATVRTSLALPGWRAELLQLTAALHRSPRVATRLRARLSSQRPAPSAARRATIRWAVVAEAAGGAQVARAWANGTDPYRLAAAVAAEVVTTVLTDRPPPGVWTAGQLLAPSHLLDRLSVTAGLRWSLIRPQPEHGAP